MYIPKYTEEQRKARKRNIVEMLLTTKRSLDEVGKAFGVSRQRVSQIYYEETGEMYQPIRRQIEADKKEAELNAIAFHCKGCNKPVPNRDRRRIDGHLESNLLKYCRDCSEIIMTTHARKLGEWRICEECGNPFEAYYSGVNRFCTKRCVSTWMMRTRLRDETGKLIKQKED